MVANKFFGIFAVSPFLVVGALSLATRGTDQPSSEIQILNVILSLATVIVLVYTIFKKRNEKLRKKPTTPLFTVLMLASFVYGVSLISLGIFIIDVENSGLSLINTPVSLMVTFVSAFVSVVLLSAAYIMEKREMTD
jgi:magnesium-transporting ATPase (P-type)